MKRNLLLYLVFLLCQPVLAQEYLKGKIISADDQLPLPGASIRIAEQGISTTSNLEGTFALKPISYPLQLNISFLGFEKLDTLISSPAANLVILLRTASNKLDAVVISTGYQQIKKERSTGAFAQLNSQQLERVVSADIITRLDGNVSGLVFNRTNQKNDISIRGRSTIFAQAQPLVVIDDFPYEGDLSNINPNDVESITILKDAAAASVWGTRAGNGVIVITTKKGKLNQALQTSFNANATLGTKPDQFYAPRMSTADFIAVEQQLFAKGYYSSAENSASHQALTPVVEILIKKRDGRLSASEAEAQINALAKLDIRGEIDQYLYQKPVNQQYYLQLRGGSSKQSYHFSLGYDRQDAALVKNSQQRYSLNFGNQIYLLKEKLRINPQLSFIYQQDENPNEGTANFNLNNGSAFIYPYARLRDELGNSATLTHQYRQGYAADAVNMGFLDWTYQPLTELDAIQHLKNNYDYRAGLSTAYRLNPSLAIILNYQLNLSTSDESKLHTVDSWYTRDQINTFSIINTDGSMTRVVPMGSILDEGTGKLRSNNLRGQLNFNHLWGGKHELNAFAGYELRDQQTVLKNDRQYGYLEESATYQLVDYLSPHPLSYYPGRTGRIAYADGRTELTDRFLSYYGNAAYTYNGTYTATASARLDRSNLFGVASNQKGVPLGSLGFRWDLNRESFYHLTGLPQLAVRMSFGYNGNIDKSLSAYTTALTIANSLITSLPYARIVNPPNPSLRWERTKIWNWGTDFQTKNNRISGSLDFYLKNGIDLIGDAPLPPSVGTGIFRGNTSNTKGKGFDLQMHSLNVMRKLKWDTDFLFSYASDKVSSYSEESPINNYLLYGSGTGNQNLIYPRVGKPLFAIYSYKWAGLDPQTGAPRGYDADGNITSDYAKIINGTGLDDLIYHGSARPLFFGSIRNSFGFKQWSLSANIVYRLGYYIRKPSVSYTTLLNGEISHGDYAQRWQSPGDEAFTQVPSMPTVANSQRDQFYLYSAALVEKGDHIRLQDVNISYQLKIKKEKKISNASVYLYLSNLGVLWKAGSSAYDPDYFIYRPTFQSALGFRINL